jgi:hypothetical protein
VKKAQMDWEILGKEERIASEKLPEKVNNSRKQRNKHDPSLMYEL